MFPKNLYRTYKIAHIAGHNAFFSCCIAFVAVVPFLLVLLKNEERVIF
jgi:hypothetical protein